MAQIDGGGLHFQSTLDNDKLNRAIEETLRRIQGLSDGFTGSGDAMDEATAEIVESIELQKKVIDELEATVESLEQSMNEFDPGDAQEIVIEQAARVKEELQAEKEALEYLNREFDNITGIKIPTGDIEKAFQLIDQASDMNRQAVRELEAEYKRLAEVAGKAFMSGDDDAYRQAVQNQDAIQGELSVRKKLLYELEQQADELSKIEQQYEKERLKAEKSANTQSTLRVQIRNVRDEMVAMRNEADKNGVTLNEHTGRYAELRDELGRLYTIQTDIQKQGLVLSNTQSKQFQGIISGLSGIAGGYSAVTGVISMFAGKNDDLQKVMTRVQSVMAITIGLQQVSQTLYKNSAFQLVAVTKAKVLLTSATNGLSTALGISTVAAKALMATLTIGLSVAIGAAIALWDRYSSKVNKAKKEQEEFNKSFADNVFKPIGAIQMLSEKWNKLGDDLEAKRKFIQDNKKDFEDLGWAVKGVEDAERVLSSPEHLQRFINAQVAKAKAMIYTEKAYEKLKKQIELQETLKQTPEFTTVKTGGGAIGTQETTAKNWRYKQIEDELKQLAETINKGYSNAIEQEEIGAKILSELGIESAEAYAKGSIGALQKAIKEKNELLTKAATETERAILRKEIESMQKEVDRMAGKAEKKENDPFIEMLEKRKKAYSDYETWLNSTDASIRSDAKSHFAELLKDGESYIEFLYSLRSKAMETGNQPQVKSLNSMIAAEMQKKDNKEEEMELDHIKKLIEDYGLYYDERVRLHEEYLKDIEALNKQLDTETDPQKKTTIKTAIDNRTKTYEKDLKATGSGDAEYDKLVQEYESYEEKRVRIAEDYAQKRALAMEKGDTGLINQLNKAEQQKLQELDFEQLINSDTFIQLFSNLDRLTVDKMIELRNKLEAEWEKLNLSPEQLEALRSKIDEITNTINKKNPFAALADSIKRYKSGEKGVDFKDIAKSAAGTIELVKGSFDAVVGGLNDMGLIGDEITQQLISDIGDMVASAGELAMGIATGNPLQIIQGSIGLLTSAFKVFNTQDRQADRQIKKHAENLQKLEESYNDLEKAIDKALGSGRYTTTQNAIRNLEKQQKEIAKQAELERGKKKSDPEKVKEYEQALKDAKEQQAELISQLREDILGIDAKSAAEQLGQAFVDAFREGEDAIEAFGKKADDIVANIMQKMLVQKLLEQPLGNILDRYSKRWYDDRGNFIGFDTVIRDADSMGKEIKGLGEGFAKAMESLPEDIRKYFTGEASTPGEKDSLSGAIKGVSEETASKLGGQINAIRMNQAEATNLLRQQLIHLSMIAQNTSYNKYIKSIDDRMARMETSGGSLRSQGLM